VFASRTQLAARLAFLRRLVQPQTQEYDYAAAPVLLRLSGSLSPDAADAYRSALANVGSAP